jgi:hypothetical protein
LENNTKISVGFVVQISEGDWRELESIVRRLGRIFYAKRVPSNIYLKIVEEFKGEKNGKRNEFNRYI